MKKKKITSIVLWNRRLISTEYQHYRMPFGRYQGQMIKNIPIDYIKWGICNLDYNHADKFARELQRREPKWREI